MTLRIATTILLIAWASISSVHAQSGLHIAQLFGAHYRNRKDATEVLLKGKNKYNLSLFRSLSLSSAPPDQARFERLVLADTRSAIDKEACMRNGRLYYGFYQLPPKKNLRRYIFYRNNTLDKSSSSSQPAITLIYMEGTATLNELKQSFKK